MKSWIETHNYCPCRKKERCANGLRCCEKDCFLFNEKNGIGSRQLPYYSFITSEQKLSDTMAAAAAPAPDIPRY